MKTQYSCVNCKEKFTTNNLNKHYIRCIIKGGKGKFTKLPHPETLNCPYCDKQCKNTNSFRQHTIRCRENPHKIKFPNNLREYVTKVKSGEIVKLNKNQWSDPNFKVSPDTSLKSLATKRKNGTLNWTDEQRLNQSVSMKRAVKQNPDSYTSSNRGRTRQIEKYGIKFQGTWELAYYECCLATSLKVERCTERFEYEWNGIRTYNPDFYLPESDTYIEVKGYETDRDRAKWRDFTGRLLVIRKMDIMSMKQFLVNLS